ncbi:MAG: translation elongation factor Ts, partial [Butyricicoccus sp.]
EKVLTIGENLQIRRFERFDNSTVNVAYNHMGGVIGVLVGLEVSEGLKDNATVKELGKDIGMQAAAMNPSFLDKSDVDEATLAKEKEILLIQALEENKTAAKPKPEQIIHKMVDGRIGKYYEENCLLQQAFVKENKVSVEAHIKAVAKELGGEIKLVKCVRFEKGEGIEKKVDDFAAEVASMAK